MKPRLFFFFPMLAGILSGCAGSRNETAAAGPAQIRCAPVTSREISDEIKGFGSLSFTKKVDVASPSEAVLEKLFRREGDLVVKGETAALLSNPQINLAVRRSESAFSQAEAAWNLARARLTEGIFLAEARLLDNEKAEAELAKAQRSLEEQARRHENEEALFEAGGLSQEAITEGRFALETAVMETALMEKELEIRRVGFRREDLLAAGREAPPEKEALRRALIDLTTAGLQAELGAAEANMEAAARELESSMLLQSELNVICPMSGIIGARYYEEGERLKKEDVILTIIDTRSLYAVFTVSEADALKLNKGMPALVSLDGTGKTYDGKVDLVSPQADNQSFTFVVRVLLPADEEGLLKPGMFARISVVPEKTRTITVVPEAALTQKKNNQGKVFTVRGNIASERIVSFGQSFGDEREIVSGLEPGEVVVLRPDAALQDGAYVSVVK